MNSLTSDEQLDYSSENQHAQQFDKGGGQEKR